MKIFYAVLLAVSVCMGADWRLVGSHFENGVATKSVYVDANSILWLSNGDVQVWADYVSADTISLMYWEINPSNKATACLSWVDYDKNGHTLGSNSQNVSDAIVNYVVPGTLGELVFNFVVQQHPISYRETPSRPAWYSR
jgi:hypothetical protein